MLMDWGFFQLKMLSQWYTRSSLNVIYGLISFPLDRATDRLSMLHTDAYWVHCGYNSGTIGNRYAVTVWWFWNKIDVIDSFFSFFPYLLLYRTEEDAGSSPTRSTVLLHSWGYLGWKLKYVGPGHIRYWRGREFEILQVHWLAPRDGAFALHTQRVLSSLVGDLLVIFIPQWCIYGAVGGKSVNIKFL